jgi:hypothetical protein
MRRTLQIVAVVFVVLIAYLAWPLFGLKQIVDAVQSKDVSSLAQRIDAPALRRSLVEQIALAYLHASGKDKGLSPLETRLAIAAAAALAGPKVDAMLKPDSLLQLLRQGQTDSVGDLAEVGLPRLQAPNLRNLYRVMRNTEYSGTVFSILLPLTSDEEEGYRLQLTLESWTWKLSGIRLPEAVRTRIANEIVGSSGQQS